MNAAKTPDGPSKRRRIAGEVKPGEAPAASTPVKPSKPKIPKRPKSEPAVSTTVDLPAAPPRLDSVQVARSRPPATLIGLVVLAVVSVVFGAFGLWRGVDEWRGSNVTDAHADAADAAATASEEIFSYQFNKLDEHMRASQKLMTPRFAKKFRSISPALNALAPQRKIQVKAVVRHAAPTECGDACSADKATVLVFIDQARVSADTEKPVVFGNRIKVYMVDRDGSWLVDNIKAL